VPTEVARAVWRFLRPFCQNAETFIFSRNAYAWDGLDRSRLMVVPPSIDAFSPKNQPLHADTVSAILRIANLESGEAPTAPEFIRSDGATGSVERRADLGGGRPAPPDAPLLVQISRWDRLKDHMGVMKAFVEGVAPQADAHLVLAGPSAASVIDDPEGLEVLHELEGFWRSLQEPMRARVHLASLPMDDAEENAAIVNALQRRATVVAQKSFAEGFGLTVSEAMWKSRPVIGGRTGGIQDQIQDGDTGVLVEPSDLRTFAREAIRLIREPDLAARIGCAANEEVRRSFLGPRHLRQYVDLFQALLGVAEA
jgi:trehalose synthase